MVSNGSWNNKNLFEGSDEIRWNQIIWIIEMIINNEIPLIQMDTICVICINITSCKFS